VKKLFGIKELEGVRVSWFTDPFINIGKSWRICRWIC